MYISKHTHDGNNGNNAPVTHMSATDNSDVVNGSTNCSGLKSNNVGNDTINSHEPDSPEMAGSAGIGITSNYNVTPTVGDHTDIVSNASTSSSAAGSEGKSSQNNEDNGMRCPMCGSISMLFRRNRKGELVCIKCRGIP